MATIDFPGMDVGREHGRLTVRKYDGDMSEWVSRRLGGDGLGACGFVQPQPRDFDQFRIRPYEESVSESSNLFTTAGWQRVLNLAFGIQSTGAYGSATCRIGVGTATAAAAVGQTDLSATGTGRFFAMATGNATLSAGTATQRASVTATFGTGEANFAWAEWGMDQGTATGTTVTAVLLNRAVSAQGTKASGNTWTATAALDYA